MSLDVRESVPLAPLTTLGVGGPARYFAEADGEAAVVEAFRFAEARGVPLFVLGGGSNLLVADRGVDALVLRVRVRGIELLRGRGEEGGGEASSGEIGGGAEAGRALVRAGAGEAWDDLVARSVAEGWAGVECLSGIPGDVGATPIQNVGAYGQEVAETIVEVRAIDRTTGAAVVIAGAECGFGYRDSRFKRAWRGRYVITAVTFALRPGGAATVRYPELQRALAAPAGGAAPPLGEVRSAVIALRRGKSMVLDPADENGRSAGSFFMNPTLAPGAAAGVLARIEAAGVLAPGEAIPRYPADGGRVKLSAAWLIERAGFAKGTRHGAAGISTRHTLALVNRGGATAEELLGLARRVRRGVLDRFGVALSAEPDLVGFAPGEIDDLVGGAHL
ncbi:UDP-N-acetylmuramate dehydrogenase [Sorangium cellulosum So ce56]|uniref:UDP-N-acetylenolpyruvoylglucosamine reductase n=1 Tax=Sorangium cellulosum (strain So ce56) TaxID=448385 RepID=A9FBA3_SORC5|nr:UDP-N-acetylmuramate dehydrogenase [Sorangium cellulosum]CAN97993.1 UDP-N-acetylmuramate dehydrogenase [Sorangium cellulosum So ce56]